VLAPPRAEREKNNSVEGHPRQDEEAPGKRVRERGLARGNARRKKDKRKNAPVKIPRRATSKGKRRTEKPTSKDQEGGWGDRKKVKDKSGVPNKKKNGFNERKTVKRCDLSEGGEKKRGEKGDTWENPPQHKKNKKKKKKKTG